MNVKRLLPVADDHYFPTQTLAICDDDVKDEEEEGLDITETTTAVVKYQLYGWGSNLFGNLFIPSTSSSTSSNDTIPSPTLLLEIILQQQSDHDHDDAIRIFCGSESSGLFISSPSSYQIICVESGKILEYEEGGGLFICGWNDHGL